MFLSGGPSSGGPKKPSIGLAPTNQALKKSTINLGPGAGGSSGRNNLGLDPQKSLQKSAMALNTFGLGPAAAPHQKSSLMISSQAAQKSSMALASFGMGPIGGMPGQKTDIGHAGSRLDSVLGSVAVGSVVPPKPAPPAERPQVWTKSTTRSAEEPGGRRMSMPVGRPESAPQTEGSKRGSLATIQSMVNKFQTGLRLSVTEEDSSQLPQGLKREDSLVDSTGKAIDRQTSVHSQWSGAAKKGRTTSKTSLSIIASEKQSLYNSKTSLLVVNLMKNIESLTKPLRGPILLQFVCLYVVFLGILLVSWATSWAPKIKLYTALVYFAVAIICTQFGRIAYAGNINSVIPFYISVIPFATLVFVSREAHQTVFVLWLVSTGLIFLQSGHPFLRIHLTWYYIILCITYVVVIALLGYFHRVDCTGWTCGDPLVPEISVAFESVLIADCIIIMIGFLSLEAFIKRNAATLLERDTFMNQLVADNEQLKKQLKGEEIQEEEVDLEAPLLRATQILSQIKSNQSIDRMVKDEIDFVLGILSQDADKLFKPDLYQEPADADVHDWLNDMMLTDKPTNPSSSLFLLPEKSIVAPDPTADMPLTTADSRVFDLMTERLEDPEFDIFEITDVSEGRPLYYVGWFIFRKLKLAETMAMNETKFRKWLRVIESGYLASNPYHNASHAADVTHSMHYYVTRPRIWDILKPEEKIAVIIAPIIHDYNHPGKNNAFLISTSNTLAIRYNDLGVLEHFHVASVYELMDQEEYDIFSNFSPESRKLIREMTISMVLSTDMAVHFDWIGKFKNKVAGNGFDFENKQDRKLLLNMAMKCADINNPSKKLKYCRKWTEMIMDEFFKQGDEEKRLGLKVSMFMDRDTTDIPKCQVVGYYNSFSFENTVNLHLCFAGLHRLHCSAVI